MKKIMLLLLSILMNNYSQSQIQLRKWYYAPNDITFPLPSSTNAPTVSNFISTPSAPPSATSGIYDKNGKLVCYFIDGTFYNHFNAAIGGMGASWTPTKAYECVIVPFPNNTPCDENKYYIFYQLGNFTTNPDVKLLGGILDMNLGLAGNNAYTAFNNPISTIPNSNFGGIAVGKEINGERFLYFSGGGYQYNGRNEGIIQKFIINSNGISASNTFSSITNLSPAVDADFETLELDLSPDGKWLGWAGLHYTASFTSGLPRYYALELDANGNFTTNLISFNVGTSNNSADGARGVEFYQNGSSTVLYVGALTDGIYGVDIPGGTQLLVSNSSDMGTSQIELGYNGRIYANSTITSTPKIKAIDGNTFSLASGYDIVVSNITGNPNPLFYSLPDQIDGEVYDNVLYNYWHVNTFTSTSSATWTMANNPITGTTTPNAIYIKEHLTIPSGVHLVWDHLTVKLGIDAKISIEDNASLDLDGCTLTNSDCEMWMGFEVAGDKTKSQFLINGHQQGKLRIYNSSVISNARNAVSLWDQDWSHTGGIVQAEYSTFLNNRRSVEFMSYQNYVQALGYSVGNESFFKRCTLSVDDNYIGTAHPFDSHITMWDVFGVRITGCTFENLMTNITNVSELGKGISVADGGFNISSHCNATNLSPCPNNNVQETSFRGFQYGIDVSRVSSWDRTFSSIDAHFSGNIIAINNHGVNYMSVLRNYIMVGDNAYATTADLQKGIYVTNATNYRIEENTFNRIANPATSDNIGIYMHSTSTNDWNSVYKNYLNNMKFSFISEGANMNITQLDLGLVYICNVHNGGYNNINVGPDGITPSLNDGIRLDQSDGYHYGVNIAAGNTFSGSINIFYDNSNTLKYYWAGFGNSYEPQSIAGPGNVALIQMVDEHPCLSNIENGGLVQKLTEGTRNDLTNKFNECESAYLNLLYQYNQMMDGGNQNILLNQIQSTWSQDVWTLRNELLEVSPFVSIEVLTEVAFGDYLPSAMLLEICIANPEVAQNEDFINQLQYEIPTPLPQYMIDILKVSIDFDNARTILESSMGYYGNIMSFTSNALMNDLICFTKYETMDLGFDPNDSLEFWLTRKQTLNSKYDLIEFYFEKGETGMAEQVLQDITVDMTLSEDDRSDVDDYEYYLEFRMGIINDGRNLMQLNTFELGELSEFVAEKNNLACTMIKNLLCFGYDICTVDNTYIPETGNLRKRSFASKPLPDKSSLLRVYPNPATTYVTFIPHKSISTNESKINVKNVNGIQIAQLQFDKVSKQVIWDTREIPNGVYFYQLIENGNILKSGKVIVNK